MIEKYLKPKSLTWWTAIAALAYGILTKNIEIILAGLGGVGLRGAIEAPEKE